MGRGGPSVMAGFLIPYLLSNPPMVKRRKVADRSGSSKPARRASVSAGLLLFRRVVERLELFLAHPGGPFWKNRDEGAWTIPKGLVEEGEDLLAAACREFKEETGISPTEPFYPLGSIRQKAGKVVHAWAFEGDADPSQVQSNTMRMQYPPGSGRWLTFPEVDRCDWFSAEQARQKLNPAQTAWIERIQAVAF